MDLCINWLKQHLFSFFSFLGTESILSAPERHKMSENTKSREDTITYISNKYGTARTMLVMCVREFSEQRFFAFIFICAD